MLENTDMNIVDIAFAVGFRHLHAFVECFVTVKGMTPKAYRQMKSGVAAKNAWSGSNAENLGRISATGSMNDGMGDINDLYNGEF